MFTGSIFLIACCFALNVSAQNGLPTRVEVGRRTIGFDFSGRVNLPHGIAADVNHVFVTEPLNRRVVVINRFTGEEIAEIPQPPGGFLLPFAARIDGDGKLVILDSGGFPSPTSLAIPRVYVYSYARSHHAFVAIPNRFANVMVVASDQEHRIAALNAALTQDITTPPFLLTKVILLPTP